MLKIQLPTSLLLVGHMSKKSNFVFFFKENKNWTISFPKTINSLFFLFYTFFRLSPFFPKAFKLFFLQNSTFTYTNDSQINFKTRDSCGYIHHHAYPHWKPTICSRAFSSRGKTLIWKSQVLIPFTIADITYAFAGPFPDCNINVARISEFSPCNHRTKPLTAINEPLDLTYMTTRIFRSAPYINQSNYLNWLNKVES